MGLFRESRRNLIEAEKGAVRNTDVQESGRRYPRRRFRGDSVHP